MHLCQQCPACLQDPVACPCLLLLLQPAALVLPSLILILIVPLIPHGTSDRISQLLEPRADLIWIYKHTGILVLVTQQLLALGVGGVCWGGSSRGKGRRGGRWWALPGQVARLAQALRLQQQ